MHTIKLKQTFTILLIFLFYLCGIWLSHGKAETVSTIKDSEQVPANNKLVPENKETRFFVETGIPSLEKFLHTLSEDDLRENIPDEKQKPIIEEKRISFNDKENIEYSHTFLQIPFNTYSIISEQLESHNRKKIQVSDTEAKYHQTIDQKPSSDIVEDKIHSFDTADVKNIQESPSVSEDDQVITAERDHTTATSPVLSSNPSPDEEVSLAEEESCDHTSVVDNKQQEDIPDEEKTVSPGEEESLISQQVNIDESESRDRKEKDIPSDPSEPSPATTHEKEAVLESSIENSEGSDYTPPVNEDKQGIITDKDILSDVKEEETLSITSTTVPPAISPDEEEPLVNEEEGTQSSEVIDEQGITPDDESISLLEEEESQTDHQPVSSEKTIPPNTIDEDISSSVSEFPSAVVHEKETPAEEETQTAAEEDKYHQDIPEKETLTSPTINEPSNETEGEASMLLNKDIQEANEKIDLQKPAGDVTEGEGEIKYTWKIWHSDPTHSVILAVVITLIAAKIGGWAARMIRFPGVVGKLILGMILGNFYLITGSDYFDFLKTMPFIKMISYFGTLVLLLTAGLATDLRAILRVGASSFLVCLGGIAAPAGLGLIVSYFLLPDATDGTKLLLAILLCNSSTGLLLAILSELNAVNSLEGRVIAGATILTDIIIILTFGVVSGVVAKGGISLLGISVSFGVAICFLVAAVIIIFKYGEKFGNFLTKRSTEGINIPIVAILSLLLAFMFGSVGLHTVIGAFIAGLFLRNVKLRDSDDREHRNVESFIRPFYVILVPILFVRVGAQVDLKSFFNTDAVLLGLAITGAAIAGKMFCCICPIERGIKRLAIGIGMATKLEGTLILAGIGRDIGILNNTVFSSIIMVIVLTSTICPFLMRILLLRKNNMRYESISVDTEKKELEGVTLN